MELPITIDLHMVGLVWKSVTDAIKIADFGVVRDHFPRGGQLHPVFAARKGVGAALCC